MSDDERTRVDAIPGSGPSAGDELEQGLTGDDGPAAKSRRDLTRPLAVLSVVFFLGAVTMALLAASLSSDLDAERGDRRDAQRVASAFAAQVVTFDHEDLDRFRDRLFELSTPGFEREYNRAFPSLREVITAGRTQSRGTVSEIYLTDVDEDGASAIVSVDTVTSGRAGERRNEFYMQLDLVRDGDGWLVDRFTSLNFGALPTTPTTSGS